MKKSIYLITLLVLAFGYTNAQSQASAETILKKACQTAARENKNVFIIFHASWCGWCHQMDSIMQSKDCKSLFTDNYVIRHIDVKELPEKKALENPGGEEMMKKYHGDQQGIPYWFIADKNGKILADSRIKPENAAPAGTYPNAGCPAEPQEVAYFVRVLKATSSLNDGQLAVIQQNFQNK